tara:strand:+ start:207 stop:494 length:288 start_codon:yes stop_codon:yes gene_type:complete
MIKNLQNPIDDIFDEENLAEDFLHTRTVKLSELSSNQKRLVKKLLHEQQQQQLLLKRAQDKKEKEQKELEKLRQEKEDLEFVQELILKGKIDLEK